MKKFFAALAVIFIVQTLGLRPNTPQGDIAPLTPVRETACAVSYEGESVVSEVLHGVLHLPHDVFLFSTARPREYDIGGRIYAGVVPHHVTAATMISGFFYAAAENCYDLVIIVAPNHEGDFAPVILSDRDWAVGEGVVTHRGFVEDMLGAGVGAAVSHLHMESDHAAGILIPYIYYYLRGVMVAPLLLNRSLSFDDTIAVYNWLEEWIAASGLRVLLVASVDFSHFLTPREAAERDRVTETAILAGELEQIHHMSDFYVDSPASLIIFLKHLNARGLRPQIVDRACAADFLGAGLDETTSYMIIFGAREERERTRLSFVGDIMLHEPQMRSCFDRTFVNVAPILQSADFAIGNLETTFSGFFSCFPLFSAPDEFGFALQRAGFDMLSTANNHSLDHGAEGLLRTLDFLDELGIVSFGTYRNQADRDSILIREVNGIRFAFLAYTFCSGANAPPHGRGYLINLIDVELMQNDIKKARDLADIVIVMPHMGNEYELFVRREFQDAAMMMLQAGADVVVAGHPHVVQPMGFVGEGFVAYCLGNFISSQQKPHTDEGVILNLYFEKTENGVIIAGASYIPTRVRQNQIHVGLPQDINR